MMIDVEVEVYSGISYFIEYSYWIDGRLWIDQKNYSLLWKKEGGHYKKVTEEW